MMKTNKRNDNNNYNNRTFVRRAIGFTKGDLPRETASRESPKVVWEALRARQPAARRSPGETTKQN
jgi:hypothetical protein